jgi:hypothetical protein
LLVRFGGIPVCSILLTPLARIAHRSGGHTVRRFAFGAGANHPGLLRDLHFGPEQLYLQGIHVHGRHTRQFLNWLAFHFFPDQQVSLFSRERVQKAADTFAQLDASIHSLGGVSPGAFPIVHPAKISPV